MNNQRSVLIVDQSEENREVLRTVLERHGVRIITASRTKEGADLARRHHRMSSFSIPNTKLPILGFFAVKMAKMEKIASRR